MFIPAAPGGGWDGTGRAIELAMRTDKIVNELKFEHVPGAGGAVGLPKFLAKKGQGDAVMVAGMVMVGAPRPTTRRCSSPTRPRCSPDRGVRGDRGSRGLAAQDA